MNSKWSQMMASLQAYLSSTLSWKTAPICREIVGSSIALQDGDEIEKQVRIIAKQIDGVSTMKRTVLMKILLADNTLTFGGILAISKETEVFLQNHETLVA
jgi:hypothetical protein